MGLSNHKPVRLSLCLAAEHGFFFFLSNGNVINGQDTSKQNLMKVTRGLVPFLNPIINWLCGKCRDAHGVCLKRLVGERP